MLPELALIGWRFLLQVLRSCVPLRAIFVARFKAYTIREVVSWARANQTRSALSLSRSILRWQFIELELEARSSILALTI